MGQNRSDHLKNLDQVWQRLRALALGESLPMIGRLPGHTQVETTARYARLAEDSARDSAA